MSASKLTQPKVARETQKRDKKGKLVWIGLPSGYGQKDAALATIAPREPVARTQMHETTDWYPRAS